MHTIIVKNNLQNQLQCKKHIVLCKLLQGIVKIINNNYVYIFAANIYNIYTKKIKFFIIILLKIKFFLYCLLSLLRRTECT